MADLDDELAALRHADPVDPSSLPSADDPRARALFERITMTDTSTLPDTEPASTPGGRRAEPRSGSARWLTAAVAAAAVVLLGVGVAIAALGGDDEPAVDDPGTASGPITPGGSSATSCVETYDLTTLANREVAFDGTVQRVEGERVTFTVNRWFTGGSGDTVTLDGASALAGPTSTGTIGVEVGARMLVAGDGGFAWSCGFSQPYDAAVADDWARVFG